MKILFLTNGLGLGNSTRCHAIIQHLKDREVNVEMVTSGNGVWYFSDKNEIDKIYEIEALAYGSKDGAISITRTFTSISAMIKTLKRNADKLSEVLDTVNPNVIVTDSDYNFLPIKKRKIPIVALNNADVVWHSFFKFKDRPDSIKPQFFGIEMLDHLFHKIVPDLVVSPTLDPSVPIKGKNILRVGPIVRKGYKRSFRKGAACRAVVMLSGSAFGTPVDFKKDYYPIKIDVIGRSLPNEQTLRKDVVFHGKVKNTYQYLKNADIAVVNGGFSAVSEMCWMGIPVIVVPVPRHAEQWINARTVQHLGLGDIATQENYEQILIQSIGNIPNFRKAYNKITKFDDGANQAAGAIIDIANT